jgi:hypothetical protein
MKRAGFSKASAGLIVAGRGGFFMRKVVMAAMAGLVACVMPALAAITPPPETCKPETLEAMQKMAQARAAKSKAIADEIFMQDDSVLALTCFNTHASVAGQKGGVVFSGDYRVLLAPAVEDTLRSYYGNFAKYTLGAKTGLINYDDAALSKMELASSDVQYSCNVMGKLWDVVNSQGVSSEVPYTTQRQDAGVDAEPTGGGSQHDASLATATSTDAQTAARDALDPNSPTKLLPKLEMPPCKGRICNTSEDTAICQGARSTPAGWDVDTACPSPP